MARQRISRFHVLAAGLMLELCGGSIYIVSLYLHDVASIWFPGDPHALDKVESLAFMCNLGNWIPLAGFFYDWRYGGPRRTVMVAVLLTLLGYGGLWLMSVHVPEGGYGDDGLKFALLHVLWFAWGHGSGYFDCACIATTAHNFPAERGTAMGVAKALYGLSGSLLTQPHIVFFAQEGGAPAFLGFLALFLSALGLAVAPFVRTVPAPPAGAPPPDQPRKRLGWAGVLIVLLALAMAAFGILHSLVRRSTAPTPALAARAESRRELLLTVSAPMPWQGLLGQGGADAALAVAVGGTLLLPTVAWGSGGGRGKAHDERMEAVPPLLPINGARSEDIAASGPADAAPGSAPAAAAEEDGDAAAAAAAATAAAPTSLEESPITVTLRRANFWLLFIPFFAGGLIVTNHMSYIVAAQLGMGRADEVKRTTDALVSLFSVCNAFGRLGAGLGSDQLQHLIDRPLWFAAATALMGASHALLLLSRCTFLIYVATIGAGVAYGAFWSLLPTLIGDLFGLRAFASTYNAYTPAVSGASLLLSTQLAARVAEAHTPPAPPAPPGAPPPPPPPCYGDGCYQLTHIVVLALCAAGVASCVVLWLRVRGFYAARRRAKAATAMARAEE